LKSLLNESFNKIYEYVDKINEYKEKLENKIKEYEIMKKEIIKNKEIKESNKKISKDKDCIKFYGFINNGNNCYLNSSLQLLTRINELKNGILNYQDNEINKNNDTKGQLFDEFKKMIIEIENSKNNNLTINPEKLKYIMNGINGIYYGNSQEDSNEFISNFISGLFKETASKDKSKVVQKLDINNEPDKKAYESFFNRFYIKKGYSFLIDIFYGIFKIKNFCKTCKNTISIKFNAYNMFELPLYKLAKKYKNKTLDLKEILNEYRAEKSLNYKCDNCKISEIYTKIFLYTLPKYLILSFIRNVDDEYFYNDIKYDETLDIQTDYNNKSYNYSLECVIEHSGGGRSGHYTALCKDKKNNKWYRFNDSYCDKYNYNFHSKNALLLLYKLSD
jgi:ubiquitin C-terminal hydrolase